MAAMVSTKEAAAVRPVAGPGPATVAAKATRSLPRPLVRDKQQQQRQQQQQQQQQQTQPVSILRKPSVPLISTVPVPPVPLVTPMSPYTSSSPVPSPLAFPPLPPLPLVPGSSANAQRRSAPSASATTSQPLRARNTRSRVSFSDEVEIAVESRSSTSSSSRPYSHGHASPSLLTPPTTRRPSAEAEAGMRGAGGVSGSGGFPRPALKRALSATVTLRPSPASASDHDEDSFDAFRPQTLRYPRALPALARLSDSSISTLPLTWSGVPGSPSVQQPLTSSPQTMTPDVLPSSPAPGPPPPTPGSERERSRPSSASSMPQAEVLTTPAKPARVPRSPIPSWSSTCPSLTSSHRASLASTLTAPSVTSLLLSPHSPHDHPLPTRSVYLEEHGWSGSPKAFQQRDSTDMSDFETFVRSPKARQSVDATTNSSDGKPRQLQPAARIKAARKGDSGSVSVLHNHSAEGSTTPPPSASVPRASERLLRLQSSLADLRMQRRTSSPEKPGASASKRAGRSRSSSRSATPNASSSRATSTSTPQPPSPTVADVKRHTSSSRASKAAAQRVQQEEDKEESGNESDLDLSLPLLNAALRSHVIPSSSRLLTRKNRNSKAQASDEEVEKLGWSGSDSEEEEFSRTVARIAARKSGTFSTRRLSKRPSLPAGRLSYTSRLPAKSASGSSDERGSQTSSVSGGPPTPSIGERPSTALGTSRTTNSTAELLSALGKKYALREELPRPKRFIGGWGAPEVLIDDEWPELAIIEHDESTTPPGPMPSALPLPLGAQW